LSAASSGSDAPAVRRWGPTAPFAALLVAAVASLWSTGTSGSVALEWRVGALMQGLAWSVVAAAAHRGAGPATGRRSVHVLLATAGCL
jgi:hypothetical protein